MERITFNSSLSTAVVHAWATEFNRAHREAPISASMWRLRFAAAVTFVTLVFLVGRALAETNADAPTGKPDVVINLATKEGVDLVKGQWHYSDTKIIPVDFRDKAGNLYVSGPGGLWILSPEGKHLGTIIAPKHPHNFAWGDADGKTLYLCARSGLYRVKLNIEGIRP